MGAAETWNGDATWTGDTTSCREPDFSGLTPRPESGLSKADRRRIKADRVVTATAGLLLALGIVFGLSLSGLIDARLELLAYAAAATLVVEGLLWWIPRRGWDLGLTWDPDYLYTPMAGAILLLNLYVYCAFEIRFLILLGWFAVLPLVAGLVSFFQVMLLAALMTLGYGGTLFLMGASGTALSLPVETATVAVFLAINVYVGAVFRHFEKIRREARLALVDPLTGLANRRFLGRAARVRIAEAKHENLPCSVVMVDVDLFKRYNDTFGHRAGDSVLRGLARLIRTQLRSSDIAARYGGEEFALVLQDTNKRAALVVLERLRASVASQRFGNGAGGLPEPLTISVGIATFPEDGRDYRSLVHKADSALYQAKTDGRNRVHVAD